MQRYLDALEIWLSKWGLEIAAHKCFFNIYLGNVPILIKDYTLKLKIFSNTIPIENNHKYLGFYLDRRLNFIYNTQKLKMKCSKLLNVLRSLSYKNWALCQPEEGQLIFI